MPDDVDFGFQVDPLLCGQQRPRGVPWVAKGKSLLTIEGKSIEVIIKDKQIMVIAPRICLRLTRVHDDPFIQWTPCAHN